MHVYLVRHGDAMSEQEDPARPLNDAGARQAERVAAFLKPRRLAPAEVWHSPKARAEGTARILLPALDGGGLVKRSNINPTDPPAPVADELNALDDDIMLVGHLPFLSRLASLLLVGDEAPETLDFAAGAAACLGRDAQGIWRVEWMVSPESLSE